MNLNKKEDLRMEWSEFSYVLKPSPLGGIGVFATHDIAAGTLLANKGHKIRVLKIKDIPPEFLKYCIYINNEECVCPERFDHMEIGWFINHSATPTYSFYALKAIKAGDEIVMDYNSLNEPADLKEDYYKNS